MQCRDRRQPKRAGTEHRDDVVATGFRRERRMDRARRRFHHHCLDVGDLVGDGVKLRLVRDQACRGPSAAGVGAVSDLQTC